jgi:hypothetical protein
MNLRCGSNPKIYLGPYDGVLYKKPITTKHVHNHYLSLKMFNSKMPISRKSLTDENILYMSVLWTFIRILSHFTIRDLREIRVIESEASPASAFPNQPSHKSS